MTTLGKVMYALNMIPDQKNVGPNGESSYELAKELSDLLTPRYYLLGEAASRAYDEGGVEEVMEDGSVDFDLTMICPEHDPADTLAWEIDGWMGFIEITEEDFNTLSAYRDEQLD